MEETKIVDRGRFRVPNCSISEEEGLVAVSLEMPGVRREDLEIRVEGNELSLRGGIAPKEAEGSYLLRERRREPFRKVFTIDETIDRERIDAELADGVLFLKLRVKEAAKPRRIELR